MFHQATCSHAVCMKIVNTLICLFSNKYSNKFTHWNQCSIKFPPIFSPDLFVIKMRKKLNEGKYRFTATIYFSGSGVAGWTSYLGVRGESCYTLTRVNLNVSEGIGNAIELEVNGDSLHTDEVTKRMHFKKWYFYLHQTWTQIFVTYHLSLSWCLYFQLQWLTFQNYLCSLAFIIYLNISFLSKRAR